MKIRHQVKIVLIAGEFPTFATFGGNIIILRQRENSAAWLKILWPMENCGP